MPIPNVLLDCAGFVVTLGLVSALIRKTGKPLTPYFIAPMILLAVHVYGNTVQELELGPEWIRNHLHNTGVAGLSLIFALGFALRDMKPDEQLSQNELCINWARYAMNQSWYYWLLASAFGVTQEIVTVAIWGEHAKAMGYSGKVDWFDLSAYAIGVIVVTANHLLLKPRVLTRMQQRYDTRP